MSALDDIIARDSAPQQASPLSSIIARDAQVPQQQSAVQVQPQQVAQQGAQPGYLASLGAGLGHGLGSTVLGAQQLLGRGLTAIGSDHVGPWLTNDAEQGIKNLDSQVQPYAEANPITTTAGKIGGNIVGTAPLAALAPEALAATTMGRIGTGAAIGAASGATAPVDPASQNYWGDKGQQALTGGAWGAGGAALANALGGIVGGANGAAQRRLADSGVTMTPGQILGGGAARTEEKLTSVPILGDFIKNAQQRSVQSFNRAAYDNALEPLGQALPRDIPIGSDAVQAVRNRIGQVYQSIEPRANFVADQNFNADVGAIRNNLAQTAPATLQQFDNIVQNQVTNKLQHGFVLDGQQWGNTRSEISTLARNQTLGNATPDNRALAGALGDLNDAINAGVGRASPPDVLPDLARANAAYARYKQIENAAGSAGASNNGNVFTAAQFQNSIRRGSTSGQKATNSGLNAQFGADAQDVLGAKYPNSGTPGRAAIMAALGALGGHAVLPPGVATPAIGAGALAALPYTGLGQRATQALLMARPQFAQPVGQFIRESGSPFAAALGAALANH